MTPEPNKIIRVFARRTKWTPIDDLAFYDAPPIFDLPDLPVYVSVTFSWDLPRARELWKSWIKRFGGGNVHIGGPALASPCRTFTPGQFIKEDVTFTSRGCPKRCPWCLVPRREGNLQEIAIQPGHIIQDNNLLACSRRHFAEVCGMLLHQRKATKFSGGLDIDYLTEWHIEQLKKIRVKELWVACDTEAALAKLDKAADLLADFPTEKKRCYVLVGYNGESAVQTEARLETVYAKGFLPFAQLYRGPDSQYGATVLRNCDEWMLLVRKWSRPAAYRSKSVKSV